MRHADQSARVTALQRLSTFPFDKFIRFGIVGILGLAVDTSVVYALTPWSNLYVAGLVAFPVAASFNWMLNRHWTYRERKHAHISARRQFMLFILLNSAGFVLNRGTYIALIATTDLFSHFPVLAVAAGAMVGMVANFGFSHRIVFRQ